MKDDSQITVDIISCWTHTLPEWRDPHNGLDNFLRKYQFQQYYNKMNDVYEFSRAFPKVNFRYFITPSEPYTTYMLDFRSQSTQKSMDIGRKDGANAVKAGEKMSYIFDLMNQYETDPEIVGKYASFGHFMFEWEKTHKPEQMMEFI